jgi:hypothetical protein
VSAPVVRSASMMLSELPTTGHALDLGRRRAVDAGADDHEAGVALAAQLADQLSAGALATRRRPPGAGTGRGREPVQALARGVAQRQGQQHGVGRRDEDVDPRRLQTCGEADDSRERQQSYAGVEDPAELLAAGAQEAELVGAHQRAEQHPDERRRDGRELVDVRRAGPEAQQQRGDDGDRGGREVEQDQVAHE